MQPKFDTGAAENLRRAACGPRATLWPPLRIDQSEKTSYLHIKRIYQVVDLGLFKWCTIVLPFFTNKGITSAGLTSAKTKTIFSWEGTNRVGFGPTWPGVGGIDRPGPSNLLMFMEDL